MSILVLFVSFGGSREPLIKPLFYDGFCHMPTLSINALFGYLLLTLLVIQQATACYEGHGDLAEPVANAVVAQSLVDCSDSDSGSPCDAAELAGLDQECNHCCHCHAGTSLCLPAGHYAQWPIPGIRWLATIDSTFPHEIISALYRPPIA